VGEDQRTLEKLAKGVFTLNEKENLINKYKSNILEQEIKQINKKAETLEETFTDYSNAIIKN